MFLASRTRFVGLAYGILGNREDAEDAVQDALVSAYRHLHKFEGRSAFKTWFTRIVLNAALMVRRKRKPWIEPLPKSYGVDETHWTDKIPTSQPDPEMACAEEETFQVIDVLLDKMSPILREAFTMTYFDEMSYQEAGAVLGVTTGTFKSRLLRARRHLMKRTHRTELAPIRRAAHSALSADKNNFQALAARPGAISTSEIAFS